MKRLLRIVIVVLFPVIALSACASRIYDGNATLGPKMREVNAMPPAQAAGLVGGHTLRTFDAGTTLCTYGSKVPYCFSEPGHGTQVEYLAPDGRTYLWYPGNSRAVVGGWRLARNGSDHPRYDLCFVYYTPSRNPLTGSPGSREHCEDLAGFLTGVTEWQAGDLFNLASGKVPFRLSREETSFAKLQARAGSTR